MSGLPEHSASKGSDGPTPMSRLGLLNDGQCWFCLRDTEGEMGRYVILSHRWVQDTERVKTLRSNYRDRLRTDKNNFPTMYPHEVTKVFQEAAQLASRLGIQYIWIDSLCIIQDDDDDWKREATNMARYYQDAWLTIAAHSSEGLYFPAVPEVLPSTIHLPYTDDAGQHAAGLSIQPMDGSHLRDIYRKAITESELLSRGWVVQEWLLSSRIVAFSETGGVFLVCSEDPPRSALSTVAVEKDWHWAADMSYKSALDLSLAILSDIRKSWIRVVESYSGMNLTNVASDRLIALAGVASAFGSAFRSALDSTGPMEYYCGLWWDNLARGLCWEPVDQSNRVFGRVLGFPSWTWASLGRMEADGKGTGTGRIEPAAVRWHTQWPRNAQECFEMRWVLRVSDAVDETTGQLRLENPVPISALWTSEPSATWNDFGIINRFIALGIKGQLFNGFLTANYLIGADTDDLATSKRPSNANLYVDEKWHRVTKPGYDNDAAIGWASFDDPSLRVENTDSGPCVADRRRRPIYGIPLSRANGIPVWKNGSIVKEDINAVLFVIELEVRIDDEHPRCFERVGVGRIIGGSAVVAGGAFAALFRREDDRFWLV
ncbi:hypothetical protein KVR01_011827 [Diaporthe batatas]|uniref:uncharacterized protein n=1 Tax=Diaporthe batatas TaxID=748121 RepID=UPI001D042793|nr:uncharacterized protein KVR01_011827 [Diaporthe batatas]KAG8158066.1 hypothetical protein KVR01_011827 [Diaporthe batatas]